MYPFFRHNPIDDMSFAGCIQDVKYSTIKNPNLVLEDINLGTGLQSDKGVQLNGCYDQVSSLLE